MAVNLFIPCVVDWFYPEIGKNAVGLLERAGYEVNYDPKQGCCGRYAKLMGCKSIGEEAAKNWLDLFRGVKDPIVFPDSACYQYIKQYWPKLEWSDKDRKALKLVLENCYELSSFFLEYTKLTKTTSLGRVGVFDHSPIHQILSNSIGISTTKFNGLAQLSDVTPLFFKNVSNVVKKDFLYYLQAELTLNTFVDNNVVLVRQLQNTAKSMGATVRVLHFTELG